jgi:hypothetical protein
LREKLLFLRVEHDAHPVLRKSCVERERERREKEERKKREEEFFLFFF